MKRALIIIAILTLCSAARAQNDLTIKRTSDIKVPGLGDMTSILKKGSSSSQKARVTTILVKGSRLRSDSEIPSFNPLHPNGTRTVSYIQQCDLGRTVHLDHKKKSFAITSISADGGSDSRTTQKVEKAKKGGYIDVSLAVTDTNERKNMFGFVARHLKSTTTMTPSPNACSKQAMSIEDDGWYVDLPSYSCEIQTEDTMDSVQETAEGCADEVHVKAAGNIHLGFALQETRTMSMNGMSFQILENVVSLDRSSLDPSLFEIPADFHSSGDSDTATPSATAPSSQNAPSANSSPGSQYPADWQNKPLPQMSQVTAEGSVPPKQPGVIRIGVVTPTADMGQGFEGIDSGQIVQAAFLEHLKADKIEAVAISSGVLIKEEAKLKECDYLLYADVKRKKGGGGFFKQMLMTNLACMGGNAACAAASAAGMAGRLKNKDEITLEYHVDKTDGGSARASTTLKQKAQKDGDDVLSPMISESSKNIIAAVGPGK